MDALVTLKDGSQVSKVTFKEVFPKLEGLKKTDSLALWDLTEKCRNISYKILLNPRGDTVDTLTNLRLMMANKPISKAIERIVLNSVKGADYFHMTFQNPLKKGKVTFNI